ncbi:MAG: hypothetical protein KDK33_09480 [Leptospiraceae bacterium]|nr:hypothetical protein [Leptospiraceae bacterium]
MLDWIDVGHFRNGALHGKGKRTYANGEYYVGDFLDGVPWGQGILYAPDGTVLKAGYWWNGSGPNDFGE